MKKIITILIVLAFYCNAFADGGFSAQVNS